MTNCSPSRNQLKLKKANLNEFVCEFCKRGFVRERTLFAHICEPKRRHLQRDERPVKLGFIAYQQFYARSMSQKNPPSYESFTKSNLYTAFVAFGRHLIDLNAVNPRAFIDFLLRIEAPIGRWNSPAIYETYIRELNKNETPLDALERNFLLMEQWAHETMNDWRDFFRLIEPPLAALWISSGRISPWLLFLAGSAIDLIDRFNPEQKQLMERHIDPEFWRLKIERHRADVDTFREILAEKGI